MSEISECEPSTIPEGSEKSNDDPSQHSNESLLSILHEKNKTIERLQKQLHFQKLQLKFYLSKHFESSKVTELSKTCQSNATEENLLVNLALSRFCKKMGFKSKIIVLYERMCNMEDRVNTILQVQECVIRKILSRFFDLVKIDEVDVKRQLKKLLANPEYTELFNNLIHANVALRKNLDVFRICCDRLIVIEEERNMIVEQVYSLPIEQRTNCNYLIGIQVEKVQLQNRLKEILKDQDTLRNRIEELHGAEDQLRKLQEEYKAAYRLNTENVTSMLRKVNREALGLIAKSNAQRDKYTREIVKLKTENSKISSLLEQVKRSMDEREIDAENLKLGAVYSAGLFSALDDQITQAIRENELAKDAELQRMRAEKERALAELRDASGDNEMLRNEVDELRRELLEVQTKWADDVANFEKEREDSRAKIDDLQAIRSAYAQLVDSRADLLTEKKLSELNEKAQQERQKYAEIEKTNANLLSELRHLTDELGREKSKIYRLSQIIIKLNGASKQKVLDVIQYQQESSTEILSQNENAVVDSQTQAHQKNAVSSQHITETSGCAITHKISHTSAGVKNGSTLTSPLDSMTNCSRRYITEGSVATTFEFRASHRDGRRDTIAGVMEGRDRVEGTLNLGDASALSVRVACGGGVVADHRRALDDFELMRDCSMETVAYQVPPLKRLPLVVGDARDSTNRIDDVARPSLIAYRAIADASSTDRCLSEIGGALRKSCESNASRRHQRRKKIIDILEAPRPDATVQSKCTSCDR